MRFATVRHRGRIVTTVDTGDGQWRLSPTPLINIIKGADHGPLGEPIDVDPGMVCLPYRPATIIGVGLNYHDTVAEMGLSVPAEPYLFPKLSSSAIGPYDPVIVDLELSRRVDWEGEVAVIIGRPTRNVTIADADQSVFGYLAANDISARDLQERDGQWLRGKGLDTFCPLGPYVVPADSVPNPRDQRIRTWHNAELVQDGTTASMIFSTPELIAYCSRFFTLQPGDLILTGTPAGCGDFRDPPIALRPSDVVEVEVTGLGRQRNSVRAPENSSTAPEKGTA